ncbi:hypothetical protein L226DRAFT_569005 [Lentinus tigrinus ALCF2SS1-7]|uniref:uncharacterized protein n=1 Tax=Lentinus tigrinus ALCF2SS1-7 TaxID=1328758 RepID=UPI0011660F68|nr:hypothetical protein L226DRAFT_569005 [Lentinus tigrinus ALCF2SS1-7]
MMETFSIRRRKRSFLNGVILRATFGHLAFVCHRCGIALLLWSRGLDAGEIKYDAAKTSADQLQARLDADAREHGDTYIDGIQSVFDVLKAHCFATPPGTGPPSRSAHVPRHHLRPSTTVDREITARCIAIMNAIPNS